MQWHARSHALRRTHRLRLGAALRRSAAMRKKVDERIRTLVENSVKLRQRGLFVVIGDRGRDAVVNLHYMLSKASVKARPSVLWCYKKDLYLSSHRCV